MQQTSAQAVSDLSCRNIKGVAPSTFSALNTCGSGRQTSHSLSLYLSFKPISSTEWKKKKECCYEKKKGKLGETVWKKPFWHPFSLAPCMWGAHPTSAVVRRAQSRQPATSASLPTNRHARLRLCAVLSVSAAEAGRRGTATAAPSIFPGMRLSVATPLFCFCSVMASLQHAGSRFADTGRFLGRGCLSFFFLFLFFVCVAHVAFVVAQGSGSW